MMNLIELLSLGIDSPIGIDSLIRIDSSDGIDSFEESIPFSPIHLTGRLKESGFTIPDFEESTQH